MNLYLNCHKNYKRSNLELSNLLNDKTVEVTLHTVPYFGGRFLSHTNQTWQTCYFLGDVPIILPPLLEISNCLKVE